VCVMPVPSPQSLGPPGVSAARHAGGRAGRLPRELCRVRHARGAGGAAGRGRPWQRRGKARRAGCAWVPACADRDARLRGAPRGRRRRRRRRQQGRLIQPGPRRAGGRFALAARGAPAPAAAHRAQAGRCFSNARRTSAGRGLGCLPRPAGANGMQGQAPGMPCVRSYAEQRGCCPFARLAALCSDWD